MEHGIPHSFFLGGPFMWTQDDQDKAMAFITERNLVCVSCGSRDDEWIDEHGHLLPESLEAYSHVCYGCRELGRARKEQGEDNEGVTWYLGPIREASEWEQDLEHDRPPELMGDVLPFPAGTATDIDGVPYYSPSD